MQVALATTSQLAAEGGARIAEAGGTGVDVAVASVLVSMMTEPGVCAPGGGGYVTIAPTGGRSVTIDGNVEMPGRGAAAGRFGVVDRRAEMAYGGGVSTRVGYGSVGTPGALAALGLAVRRWGRLPWSEVMQPAVDTVRAGFPLSSASANYLRYSHESVFGWHPESREAVHDRDGEPLKEGAIVRLERLADSLAIVAAEGPEAFYEGDLAQAIAADFDAHGGLLTRQDLAAYRPIVRPAADLVMGDWHVSTNPPPAIGGVAVLAMLHGLGAASGMVEIVQRQRWLWEQRYQIEATGDVDRGTQELLGLLRTTGRGGERAPSTVHTSAVDAAGNACAITVSSGYGSGLMPGGTGMWMNNALGEEELNPAGYHALRPGTRLPSNMAPTVLRRGPDTMAIGSPGADRITSALQQTIFHFVCGAPLADAIEAPRAHLELASDRASLAVEPGIAAESLGYPLRRFGHKDMFFGGVAAAQVVQGRLEAAADSRRTGGVYVSPR